MEDQTSVLEIDLEYDYFLPFVAVAVGWILAAKKIRRKRARLRVSPRPIFEEVTEVMYDEDFQKCFRMSRSCFYTLLDHLRPHISSFDKGEFAKEIDWHRSGRCTQAATKLAVAIRMLAGGSAHDIALAFHVGRSSAYSCLHEVVGVICENMDLERFPQSDEERREAAIRFATSRKYVNPLPGCIGAVDGITIALERPRKLYNPAAFYCRKGYYAIPVQAVVDADYRFMAVSAFCSGATHDSVALSMSNIGQYLVSGAIELGYWIAADEAYTCTEVLLTPFRRSFLVPYTDSFNFYQSSHRIHVEQTFGMWVSKWRVLKRAMGFNLRQTTRIIGATAILHNFIINNKNESDRVHSEDLEKAERDLKIWIVWRQGETDEDDWMDGSEDPMADVSSPSARSSTTRNMLVRRLQRHGLLRPPWATQVMKNITTNVQTLLDG